MKHLHLLGIEGVGMSALAEALAYLGHRVSGCDQRPGKNSERLRRKGIAVHPGHDPAHLGGVSALVVTNAAGDDHPEVRAAHKRGVPIEKRIEALARVLAARKSLGVSGTHGKTTTTAMLAEILAAAGEDPMALVGARVVGWEGGFRPGNGPVVAEVDESDRLFPRARADLALLLNLEDDHLGAERPTYHPSFEALKEAMDRWLSAARMRVVPAELAEGFGGEAVTFGPGGEYAALELHHYPARSEFLLAHRGRVLGRISVPLPGEHNAKNALAAAAAALTWGVPFEAVAEGLAAFRGTGRRFEHLGECCGAPVYDDYAHHPTEVAATLKAARAQGLLVRAVFQPHRYLRTKNLMDRFAEALTLADEAIVLDVYAAGEEPIPGVSGAALAERARKRGANARYLGREEALSYLKKTLGPGELVVFMGAGDVSELAHRLVEG